MKNTQVFKNFIDFYHREDKSINGVSPEFAIKYPDYEQDNHTNMGCWNCRDCEDCTDCYDCVDCYECDECANCVSCSNSNNVYDPHSYPGYYMYKD